MNILGHSALGLLLVSAVAGPIITNAPSGSGSTPTGGSMTVVLEAAQDRTGWPQQLEFGIIPTEKSSELAARFKPLIAHLETELGLKIKAYYGADYATVTAGMKAGTVDIGYLGPLSYVLAAREANAQAFAKEDTLKSGTGNAGVIVARRDSGIKTLADAKGKTFAFVDPQSATGYLLPMIHLTQVMKLKPQSYFKTVTFGGSHEANIESVVEGQIQTAATDERELEVAVRDGEIRGLQDLNILWKSERVPTSPLAYRRDLPASLKVALQKAVLSFKDKKALDRIGLKGFVAATDADYNVIRKLEAFKKSVK